ncbi:MAG: outer membrane beta-barrel protein [Acidobacteriota bacterium]
MVLTAGWLSLPQPAAAQSLAEPKTWTVTPFVSGSFGTSDGLGGSLGIGGAITFDVTSHLGIEGELGRVFDVLGNDANVDWAITNVSGNVVYNFDAKRITPYATFGLGVERSSPSVKIPDPAALYPGASTEVAYNFGGGVKYPLSERFLVRGDLRRFEANDLAPDHWRLYGGISWWIKR